MTTKVILTLGKLQIGGAEMRTLQLVQELSERRADVEPVMYIVSGQEGVLEQQFKDAGVKLYYGKIGIAGLVDFYRLCRREKPDVVHVSALLASGFFCFAAWLAGVPRRITHMRNTGYDRDDAIIRIRNSIFRLLLNGFSTRVVGVCAAAHSLARTPSLKWQTLYNGIMLQPYASPKDREPAWPADRLNIIFLARLDPQKNPERAVEIIEALCSLIPERRPLLHFVGRNSGALGDRLKRRVRMRGLHDHVVFHGPSDKPLVALRQASVLLLTSTREGLPGVVIEALSCGTPVVAPLLPGVCEIADRTEGVYMVGLDRSDADWVRAVVQAADKSDSERIFDAFKESPFLFEEHYRSILALWTEEPAT